MSDAVDILKSLVTAIDRGATLAWAIQHAPKHPDSVIAAAWASTQKGSEEDCDVRHSLLIRIGINPELLDGGAPLWASERRWIAWERAVRKELLKASPPTIAELQSGVRQ